MRFRNRSLLGVSLLVVAIAASLASQLATGIVEFIPTLWAPFAEVVTNYDFQVFFFPALLSSLIFASAAAGLAGFAFLESIPSAGDRLSMLARRARVVAVIVAVVGALVYSTIGIALGAVNLTSQLPWVRPVRSAFLLALSGAAGLYLYWTAREWSPATKPRLALSALVLGWAAAGFAGALLFLGAVLALGSTSLAVWLLVYAQIRRRIRREAPKALSATESPA